MNMRSKLQQRLLEKVGDKSVARAADEMGVQYWKLRDVLNGKVQCPLGPNLALMARWLGVTADEFIDLAYTEPEKDLIPA